MKIVEGMHPGAERPEKCGNPINTSFCGRILDGHRLILFDIVLVPSAHLISMDGPRCVQADLQTPAPRSAKKKGFLHARLRTQAYPLCPME